MEVLTSNISCKKQHIPFMTREHFNVYFRVRSGFFSLLLRIKTTPNIFSYCSMQSRKWNLKWPPSQPNLNPSDFLWSYTEDKSFCNETQKISRYCINRNKPRQKENVGSVFNPYIQGRKKYICYFFGCITVDILHTNVRRDNIVNSILFTII